MPKVDIKHFIAYLTYNNNGDSFRFEDAGAYVDGVQEIQVDYSAEGAAIFRHLHANFEQKKSYYGELHRLLVEEFGQGLAIVMAPESDCSDNYEIAAFCSHMKKINPDITTMIFGEASGYIPRDEKERLSKLQDDWKYEPYHSTKLLCNESVPERQSSIAAKLKAGVDYIASQFQQGGVSAGYKIIHEILGIDTASIPRNNYEAGEYVSVNPEQVEKIQDIANRAFYRAMNIEPYVGIVLKS